MREDPNSKHSFSPELSGGEGTTEHEESNDISNLLAKN